MLRLFQSIFGVRGRDTAPYPEELVRRAIERAVDGTDPRLRAVSGYQKKLRPAVIHAIDHVIALVENDLRPPLELRHTNIPGDAELGAYFASTEHMHEVLECDPNLNQWLRSPDSVAAERIVALLLMEQQERHVFGIGLQGEILCREVAQTTVSFNQHRLLDPTGTEDDTRRLLKRRAFDHLLALALGRIATAHEERGELERQRDLLRRKRAALAAQDWGFDEPGKTSPADLQALQRQLEELESHLQTLGAGADLLQEHLDVVTNVLTHAEHNLWLERATLIVDRMGVKQTQATALVPELTLTVLHNIAGPELVTRLVSVARAELPPPRDFLREARRYLV